MKNQQNALVKEIKLTELRNSILEIIKDKGGSATFGEIKKTVAQRFDLTEEDCQAIYPHSQSNVLAARIAGAIQQLKKLNTVERIAPSVWALKNQQNTLEKPITLSNQEESALEDKNIQDIQESWESKLRKVLMSMQPDAFERLIQRLLRASQFSSVEVTPRTRDGGIDGYGYWEAQDFLSFVVVFQCKRYVQNNLVGGPDIDQFIGILHKGTEIGKPERGLFFTTSDFTRDAKKATVDAPIPVKLINGDELLELLKKYKLGVQTVEVEEVIVEKDFFDKL